MAQQIELTDDVIRSFIVQPNFTKEFPFLVNMTKDIKSGCGSCGRKTVSKVPDYNSIRRAFYEMPEAQKVKLHNLVGNKNIKIHVIKPDGKTFDVIITG